MITNKRRAASALVLTLVTSVAWGCGPTPVPSQSAAQAKRESDLGRALERLPPSPEARTTLRRAPILRAIGKHQQAIEESKAAIALARERIDFDTLATLWRDRALTHLERAEPEQALAAFGQRLEIAASLKKKELRASALADSAYAFILLGRIGQADDAVVQAKLLGGPALERDPIAQERLGLIAEALGDKAGAATHFRLAHAGYRSRDDTAAARVAVFAARASSPGALGGMAEATERIADPGPGAHLALAQAINYLSSGDSPRCLTAATRAQKLATPRGLRQVEKNAHIVSARCAEDEGQLPLAIENAEAAAALIEDQIGGVRASLARQSLGFEAFLTYRLLVELVYRSEGEKATKRAFQLSERARGRAHLDAVVRSEVAPLSGTLEVPPGLARDRELAEERVGRLTEALRESREEGTAARHRDALWALEEINEAIASQNPLLSRVATPRPATVASVRRHLLDDDAVLLSYFATDQRVFVFAIDKTRAKLSVVEGSIAEIDAAVRSFRSGYVLDRSEPIDEVRAAGAELYARLIGPVQSLVRGKKRLLVVPHGSLSVLPFEALVSPSERFLVREHVVHYAVSASLAVAIAKKQWKPAQIGTTFVGVGDPVYSWPKGDEGYALHQKRMGRWRGAEGSRSATLKLERIPGTARELKAIAKLFGNSASIFLREKATEELVKSGKLERASIVHIASHGLMAPHYQALALSLDPYSGEDGFLMSSEIAQLKLNAELVVLSACQTGNTSSRSSEPVAGMALSLRSAGARSVMLSLWNVSDEATADLMVEFYRAAFKDKKPYIESLATAKRELLRGKYAHPFYWAAFTLHGQ